MDCTTRTIIDLDLIPGFGWGLGSAPVRIPIKTTTSMEIVSDFTFPAKTSVIKPSTGFLSFGG